MSRSISSIARCWIGVDGRCADVAMARRLMSRGWTMARAYSLPRRFSAVQRSRRQHREAMALGHELQDRRHRVDLHRDLGPQAQAREAGLDEHPDGVRPARNEQREARQVAQPERGRLRVPFAGGR